MSCGHARTADAVATSPALVTIGGEVAHPLRLDARALAGMPHHDVTASAHGQTGTWTGVALADLLRAAGVPVGEALRGRNLLLYVRIGAADGYHVVYSLAELDPGFRDNGVMLAYLHDGKPLDAHEGPFRVIAPHEQRPARWIRQVTSIDVLRAPAQ
ncbi:MAG: molybdopterin-dependent oxidoreductase [Proteobacteria bacterium]|nr:molybdopterin-dependent oxidoreductase [Pseudomonadota bacterium]